jgi:RNA recognition motif-containing protein
MLFSLFGTDCSAGVVADRDTGRSKGFGFVEMTAEAQAATASLNDKDHGGRPLRVDEARPRENRAAADVAAGTEPPTGGNAPVWLVATC